MNPREPYGNKEDIAMLSKADVQRLLKISKTTLFRYMKDGKLPYYKFGKSVRFRKCDIEKFVEEHRVQ